MRLASREGLEALSIGRIAEKVGMSKSGLFGHFKSKENLQREILETVADRFAKRVFVPAMKEPRGLPRLKAIHQNWTRWIQGSQDFPGGCPLIAAASELDDQPGLIKDYLKEKQLLLIHNLQKAAQLAKDEGHFHADVDVERLGWYWYSLILGYHHYRRLLNHPRADEFAEHAFDELLQRCQTKELSS
jgi:AcrR family transcriptional regulator